MNLIPNWIQIAARQQPRAPAQHRNATGAYAMVQEDMPPVGACCPGRGASAILLAAERTFWYPFPAPRGPRGGAG